MIASILLFVLGFLTASALALLIIPAIARRARRLTTRRIEASLPLTSNEIRAEKDRLRAEHAMTARRLEMEIEALVEAAADFAYQVLRPGGALAVWSADESDSLAAALESVFGNVEVQPLDVELQGRDERYWLFAARRT